MSRADTKIRFVRMLLSAAVLVGIVGGAQAQDVHMRFSVNDRPDGHTAIMAKDFADGVARRTNGKVKIEVFPNHTLAGGSFKTEIELVRSGGIDMALNSTIILGLFVDRKFDVFSLPFMIPNHKVFNKVVEGPMGAKLEEWMKQAGLTPVGIGINGFRQLTNSKRSITTIDDIKGLKFRVAGTEVFLAAFKLMGADAVTMNAQEMLQAMGTGVVDGQENPFVSILAFRMYEVQKYVTVWNYVVDPMIVYVNTRKFNSLSPDVQKILMEEGRRAAKVEMELAEKGDIASMEELKAKGMTITTPTPAALAEFQKRFEPLYAQFEDKIGKDNIQMLRSEAQKAKAALGQ
jgi:tripartite ATP-independent transporter DctP family solute receptor